jgi:uncharacterized FlaG/YvyC family protein
MDVASVSPPGQSLPAVPDTANQNWLTENRELIRTVKSIDASSLFGDGSELSFAMDPESRRPVIRVIDRQTREVLWQAPPEYMLRVAEVLGKNAGGLA